MNIKALLEEQKRAGKRHVSGAWLCQVLNITQVTLRKRARAGTIPSETSPGSDFLRFSVDELIAWAERGFRRE